MTARNGLILRICAVVIPLLAASWWFFVRTDSSGPPNQVPSTINQDEPTPDPRLTFDTPFRNVSPNVAYVGDLTCANCHSDIDKSYHRHPMGRSAALTINATNIEGYDAASKNPFTAFGRLECRIEKQPGRVLHRIVGKDRNGQNQVEHTIDASLTIGSGTHGRSYLYVDDGRVWQSPFSWYSQKEIWDLSPGCRNEENFQRAIINECLFCHTQQVEPVPNTVNRYREPIFQIQAAIGCERCHGPGELHVAERSDGTVVEGIDTSIVNPKHLSPELRDSICQQCHLQGEARIPNRGRSIFEFRPGLPLNAFVTTFIKQPKLIDYSKSVGHFEQLSISKCFTSSKGKMGCTSCHDPHQAPDSESKAKFYRGKCIECHREKGCSLPIAERSAERDNCVACHMKGNPSADIAHSSVTDHRILRWPSRKTRHEVAPLSIGELPFVVFGKRIDVPTSLQEDRALGVALARWALAFPSSQRQVQQIVLAMAQQHLEASLTEWPNDVSVLEAMAELCAAQGRTELALKLVKEALARVPDEEHALSFAVTIAMQARDTAFAEECAAKIVEMNPRSYMQLMTRAKVRMELHKFAEAEADFRAAIRENPTCLPLRANLAACLQRAGDRLTAERELKIALSMAGTTDEAASIQRLFDYFARSP
jgi:hypothetical protein